MHVVVLTKRQYTNKDVIDDRYGRLWEIPYGLARRNCRVTCICLSYRKREAQPEQIIDQHGNTVRWISVNLGLLILPGLIRYFRAAKNYIRDERPDVIWSCSDIIYTILGRHLARRFQRVAVADLYDNFEYFAFYKLPILRGRYRQAVRDSAGVSCVSEALAQHIAKDYARTKETRVITNAVDHAVFRPLDKRACREELGLPADALIIGSAGDISNYRGADMMYRLATAADKLPVPVHLAVAGHRDAETVIPDAKNVHDLGMLAPDRVPMLLNSLDVAVVYNRSSTFGDYCFPQKFYEILACGVPVVAANVGELRLLLDGHPQLMYDDEDLDSFARAIERQLANREVPGLPVPTWQTQADKLLELIEAVSN